MIVADERVSNEARIQHMDFGKEFMYDGHVCMRVHLERGVEVRYAGDGIIAYVISTGSVIEIPYDSWVEPVKTRLIIEE